VAEPKYKPIVREPDDANEPAQKTAKKPTPAQPATDEESA
jgi:hypothetical protein